MRITKRKEVIDAIAFAQETPGPVLIEYQVEKEDSVYPMVPSGAALDEMIRRPITRKKKDQKKQENKKNATYSYRKSRK
jgi:hypothetical protein